MASTIRKALRLFRERDNTFEENPQLYNNNQNDHHSPSSSSSLSTNNVFNFALNSNCSYKHEKLLEDITTGSDGGCSSFRLQYLGCIPVENPSSGAINNIAVKRIMALCRMQHNKNIKRVILLVMPNMIVIQNAVINNVQQHKQDHIEPIKIALNRVSFCFVDSTYNRLLAFISTNEHGCHECHAFMTDKAKTAKMIALTISKTFADAYEMSKRNQQQQQQQLPSPTASANDSKPGCHASSSPSSSTTPTKPLNIEPKLNTTKCSSSYSVPSRDKQPNTDRYSSSLIDWTIDVQPSNTKQTFDYEDFLFDGDDDFNNHLNHVNNQDKTSTGFIAEHDSSLI